MDFPRLVFIVPGKEQRPGGTYSHLLIESQAEFDAALKEGFSSTLPNAIEAHENPKAKEETPKAEKPPKAEKAEKAGV